MARKDALERPRPGRRQRTSRQYVVQARAGRPAAGPLPGRVPEPAGLHQAAGRPARDPAHRHPVRGGPRVPELHRDHPGRPAAAQPGRPADRVKPNPLGLVAGDAAGFPNGRRVFDDVVTIELRAVAGLTLPLVDPSFTPDGAASAIKDGTTNTNSGYLANFPYLGTPAGGYQSKPGVPAA